MEPLDKWVARLSFGDPPKWISGFPVGFALKPRNKGFVPQKLTDPKSKQVLLEEHGCVTNSRAWRGMDGLRGVA